ncbi:MAG TPA: hypothetical protein VGL94_15460 [Ktedonobacteraceae bacterium]|jgi:hypothetical protein
MSTSEFESMPSESEFNHFGLSKHGGEVPDDFSEEDFEFARELNALFSLDREEMPPLFVQTLLASEDPRLQPVETGFEKKTSARVFRRLQLKRQLFRSRRFSVCALLNPLPISRPLAAVAAICMLFMVLTMVIATPSFAQGWTYLWSGGHSGVLLVDTYPHVSTASSQATNNSNSNQMTIVQAQEKLHFPIFWPQNIPSRYTQSATYLYPGDPSWTDGPMIVLNFSYSLPGLVPRQIAICEFKPQGKVLQMVQNGAAHQIQIGRDASAPAIYVEGQWIQDRTSSPSWVYTDRSELIYEDQNSGVVFWVVGDKRDGIDGDALRSIANSLSLLDVSRGSHMSGPVSQVAQNTSEASWLFSDNVIYLDNGDDADGPSFEVLGVNPSPLHPPYPHKHASSP